MDKIMDNGIMIDKWIIDIYKMQHKIVAGDTYEFCNLQFKPIKFCNLKLKNKEEGY